MSFADYRHNVDFLGYFREIYKWGEFLISRHEIQQTKTWFNIYYVCILSLLIIHSSFIDKNVDGRINKNTTSKYLTCKLYTIGI